MMVKRRKEQRMSDAGALLCVGEAVSVETLRKAMGRVGGDVNKAAAMARMASFWLDLRQRTDRPTRRDFGPEDLKFVLPDLFMIDVGAEGGLRYRLAGTRLARRFDRDPTGRAVSEMSDVWGPEAIVSVLRHIIWTGEPHAILARAGGPWNSYPLYQAVLMPLHAEDGRISILLGAAQFLSGVPGAAACPTRLDIRPVVR